MKRDGRLLFGPAAGGLLIVGTLLLGPLVPGYSLLRQRVGEIGEIGSPTRLPFAILLCVVAASLAIFAWGLKRELDRRGRPARAWALVAAGAISFLGLALFPFPRALHTLFNLSLFIAYQAPLALALAGRADTAAKPLVVLSWAAYGAIWLGLALSLAVFHDHGWIGSALRPVYGLVQRFLLAAWFGWCAALGIALRRAVPTAG